MVIVCICFVSAMLFTVADNVKFPILLGITRIFGLKNEYSELGHAQSTLPTFEFINTELNDEGEYLYNSYRTNYKQSCQLCTHKNAITVL